MSERKIENRIGKHPWAEMNWKWNKREEEERGKGGQRDMQKKAIN